MSLRAHRQQQQQQAHRVKLALPARRGAGDDDGGTAAALATASTATAVLSHLLYSRGQAPSPLRSLSAALERRKEQGKELQQGHHFARRALAKTERLVDAFASASAALSSSAEDLFLSPSSSRTTVLVLFGPSILRPMEAYEVSVPTVMSSKKKEKETTTTAAVGAPTAASSSSSAPAPSSALERVVTMKLLQAGLPDGPATKGATKVHVLAKRAASGRGGEQLLPPPSGFVPAAGFSWPRPSYARGMLRVKIDLCFEGEGGEAGEGEGSEMEWRGASGGEEGRERDENDDGRGGGAWWSCTTTISGVAGCSGA